MHSGLCAARVRWMCVMGICVWCEVYGVCMYGVCKGSCVCHRELCVCEVCLV